MNVLVIDTATEACSVALQWDGQLFTRFEECPREHSQKLLPMVQSVLQDAGVNLTDLDGLAFGRGPGSFTGVRIATGMIQGLALGANLPVVGVSTLAAMAQQAMLEQGVDKVVSAIDARMQEVYLGLFELRDGLAVAVNEEQVIAPDTALDILLDIETATGVGTGWAAYPSLSSANVNVNPDIRLPKAECMLPLAEAAFEQGLSTSAEHAEPVYLRDKVTWKKLPGRE